MTNVRAVPIGQDVESDLVTALTDLLGARVRSDAALGWTEPPPRDEIASLLNGLTTAGPQEACALVGLIDETVVGFGYWRRYFRPTHRPHADLEKVVVSLDHPRRGIGRRLVRGLVEHARSAGVEQLTLDFRGDNSIAESLYLSEGFREYGRLPGFVAPADGRRLDKVFHVIDLRPPDQEGASST